MDYGYVDKTLEHINESQANESRANGEAGRQLKKKKRKHFEGAHKPVTRERMADQTHTSPAKEKKK